MAMQEREYPLQGGSLYYNCIEKRDGSSTVTILRWQGLASEVQVPEQIDGKPVTAVEKKAFLSKKNLRRVVFPQTVTEVGDWAFAYCNQLETVRFCAGAKIRFGRAVFLECDSLHSVYVDGEESTAALLAAAVTAADAQYLLDSAEAGNPEWLGKWDARMTAILHSEDSEGYSRQVLCGEEDYGSTDRNAYESNQRKRKIRLLMLRLLYDRELPEALREECRDYLRAHTSGCPQEETWQVVWQEHGEDSDWYRLFAEIGCVTNRNLERILSDIGEEYPEMKAYFLRFQAESIGGTDFFSGLEL